MHDNCVTPSAHNHAVPRRARLRSNFGLKFASRLNSIWRRDGLGTCSIICIGVLVMGTEHLLRIKQRRLAEPSLWANDNADGAVSKPEENAPSLLGDEHSDDVHSLLEENALLRRILVKLDLVLKKVVDPK